MKKAIINLTNEQLYYLAESFGWNLNQPDQQKEMAEIRRLLTEYKKADKLSIDDLFNQANELNEIHN